jgi:hypothetical protein
MRKNEKRRRKKEREKLKMAKRKKGREEDMVFGNIIQLKVRKEKRRK